MSDQQDLVMGLPVGALLKSAGAVIAVVTAMFAVDARYMHDAEAADKHQQEAIDRERGDLETQLRIAKLEIKQTSDPDEKDYLKSKIAILEERLLELRD